MVIGLDRFRQHFQDFEGSFILIGGAACDDWFARRGREFRLTKDLDIVLIIEVMDIRFEAAMRQFLGIGGYKTRQRSNGRPELYRFADPADPLYPAEIELFIRNPSGFTFPPGDVVPVLIEPDHHSLSAILLNDAYYNLILTHHEKRYGLGIASATALIPLKAYAWLDLSRRKTGGEHVDSRKINKHRSDVFRLAATLPDEDGPELPPMILDDLRRFMAAFPDGSNEWQAITAAVKDTLGNTFKPAALRGAIERYYRISSSAP